MEAEVIFAMYFGQVTGIQYHPANPADSRMTLEECADVAIEMMQIHRKLWSEQYKRE